MVKFKDSDIILAGAAAAVLGGLYLFSQKAGGLDALLHPQDTANKEIAPKPCGCGMEKTNHSDS